MAFVNDYVPVSDRVEKFLERYPDGRIQTEIAHLDPELVVMKATVWRDPADPLPFIAHSKLNIPGSTNFTRGSEVENAETSAVGRALAFMGFEVHKGLASREEVASRQPAPRPASNSPKNVDKATGEIAPSWAPSWEDRFIAATDAAGCNPDDIATVIGTEYSVGAVQAYLRNNKGTDLGTVTGLLAAAALIRDRENADGSD